MSAAVGNLPPDLDERPRDATYGVPVPFACEEEDGTHDLAQVVKKRAVQCALSRICGLCGRSLSWGVTFLGSAEESEADTFHLPPLHLECAEVALELYPPLPVPVLGQAEVLSQWVLVVTGGFELVRPTSRVGDTRMKFHANSVSERRTHP